MISITESVRKFIKDSPLVEEVLSRGLINLSAFARELKPKIEEELMKPVKNGSIVMALKRVSRQLDRTNQKVTKTIQAGSELTVRSNLSEYTYISSETLANKYVALSQQIYQHPNAFFTLTKGLRETTRIVSTSLKKELEGTFRKEALVSKIENLSSITITHSKEVVYMPGFHYLILKSLAWENVNVIESVSAYTEFTVIVESKDVDKAFGILKRLINE
ncbi:aspartate kinase [Candidatus Woesebacteria bacterium]|nr:aspartate kinase [Candidatus Woesebacteria bacterium]